LACADIINLSFFDISFILEKKFFYFLSVFLVLFLPVVYYNRVYLDIKKIELKIPEAVKKLCGIGSWIRL